MKGFRRDSHKSKLLPLLFYLLFKIFCAFNVRLVSPATKNFQRRIFPKLWYILMYCHTGILFVVLCTGCTQVYFRKSAVMHTNNQGLTNLYWSAVFHIQHRLVLFLGPSKPQAGSFNKYKWM